ncbi:MAG: class I SAM-dependent methyltransferase [Trichodesmium sp. MAG_R03]|nr:class I SAM-dependent methyltransferase [Trichodesmium sp. MAG_R03]
MMKLLKSLLPYIPGAKFLLMPLRFYNALKVYHRLPSQILSWVFTSQEWTNITYELTDLNKKYLTCFISQITNTDREKVREYLEELENDDNLKKHIQETTLKSPRSFISDAEARYGRRLGWYALVRIKKPKIVVETGVDKGLGSVVLAVALMKNAEEGFNGHLYCTDYNPEAGFLLTEPYSSYGTIIYGDSIETLKSFDRGIDILITDSDHKFNYELQEYETVEKQLQEGFLIISDTAHYSSTLIKFAESRNLKFLFFQEQPKDIWFPGGGIGIAYQD